MIPSYIFVIIPVALMVIACAAALLLDPGEKGRAGQGAESVITAPGHSVITVRKVGRTTRVDIRADIHSHWEGEEGVAPKPTPVEVTRREQPELFEEYMSPEATATRKYAIVDELYSMGYTLPLIPSLHEQWVLEQQMVRAQQEDPPKEDPAPRRLNVDYALSAVPMPPLGDEPGTEGPEPEEEPSPSDETDVEQQEQINTP